MPPSDIIDLEHIMIGVTSHAEAIEEFSRLGFLHRSVRQLAPMGGAEAGGVGGSAVIMMAPLTEGAANYLELSYLDEPFAQPFMMPILKGVHGGAMLVHASSNARALHERWTQAGLKLHPLVELSLGATEGGEGGGQDLKIIIPGGEQPVWCNAAQYASVDEFLLPDLMDHPNGALSWTGAVIVAGGQQYPQAVSHFKSVYGVEPETAAFGVRFQPQKMTVDVMTPESFADTFKTPQPAIAGRPKIVLVRVTVRSVEALKALLHKNDVSFHMAGASVVAAASGLLLAFSEREH